MNLFYSLRVDMTRFFLHVSNESKISIISSRPDLSWKSVEQCPHLRPDDPGFMKPSWRDSLKSKKTFKNLRYFRLKKTSYSAFEPFTWSTLLHNRKLNGYESLGSRRAHASLSRFLGGWAFFIFSFFPFHN